VCGLGVCTCIFVCMCEGKSAAHIPTPTDICEGLSFMQRLFGGEGGGDVPVACEARHNAAQEISGIDCRWIPQGSACSPLSSAAFGRRAPCGCTN
jgi:hypothetical protein